MEDCWKVSEKPTFEANVARELAAAVVKRSYEWRRFRITGKKRVVKKLNVRTKEEVAAKDPKVEGGRLKLTSAGQYGALACGSNIINTTSEALATGGGDLL
jgi:hypothetical protein